jgi:citrate lyase beta subunit
MEAGWPRGDFRRVRSVMETPILDERKWAKLPGIEADAFIIDLEDSVVPQDKIAARDRAVHYLREGASFFGDRLILARPNNLDSPWGRADIIALAQANVRLMLYPKAKSAAEVAEVRQLLAEHGAVPLIFPIIETAGALLDVRTISEAPGVGGLFMGIGDLSVDAGIPFRLPNGEINPALHQARDQVALAAAAAGISSTDTVYARDIRNPDDVRAAVRDARDRGFTSLVTFYPPHVPVINEAVPPSPDEIADAELVVETYSEGVRDGKPAVLLEDGRVLLLLDSDRAQRLLDRASAVPPSRKDFA